MDWRPKFVLVPICVLKEYGRTLISLSSHTDGVRVGDAMLVEPFQVFLNLLGANKETVPGCLLPQSFSRGKNL